MRPPLLLIHGAGGDHLSWPPEIRRLPGVRVYTLDLPGHGKTPGLGRQYVEDYARSLLDFLDTAVISRPVLGGHGMGGGIALAFALEHPDRVSGLILVSSGPRLSVPAEVLENGANPSTLTVAINSWLELSFYVKSDPILRETVYKRLVQVRQPLLYGDWLACDRFDVVSRIDCIRAPTLVICGTRDHLTPLHLAEKLASGIPGAALQTVQEAGHMLILEQPKHVANLISLFFATIPYMPGL